MGDGMTVEEALDKGYKQGYDDGYVDGYIYGSSGEMVEDN
jgi:flagellar biosynthesis/type III secretory pathway protein FliH